MFLGTINTTDYYHTNTGKEAKSIIKEISENPVKFVTESEFDAKVDRIHEKAEYIAYFNSMNTILAIIISLLLLSCSATHDVYKDYAKVYSVSYGDERFTDCKDIVEVTYGITMSGDTTVISQRQKYNCNTPPKTWADETIHN